MYIGLLMGFISRFSQMDGQHWFELWTYHKGQSDY
jgi:hypothetical protein